MVITYNSYPNLLYVLMGTLYSLIINIQIKLKVASQLQGAPNLFLLSKLYIFYGSDAMKRLEIGNAVPPLLSMAIAKQMVKALENSEVTE